MRHPTLVFRTVPVLYSLIPLLLAAGCAVYRPAPLPAPVEPSLAERCVSLPQWDVAAVRYRYSGVGLDWSKAGLEPVLLLFKNKGSGHPLVSPFDILGLSGGNRLSPLPPQQAADIAAGSVLYKETVKATLAGSAAGALIGAGLGALFAAPVGGSAVWQSALVGGGIGAVTGAAATAPRAEADIRMLLDQEFYGLAWSPVPVPPYTIIPGWLYFPAGAGVEALLLTVRSGEEVAALTVPVSNAFPPPPAANQRSY